MFTRARDHWLMSNRSAGNGRRALRSSAANTLARDPSRLRKGRWFKPPAVPGPRGSPPPNGKNSDDPALHDLYADFHLGLISGTVGTRRYHAHAVMHGQFLVSGVEIGIVAARAAHSGAQVIRHQQPRNATKIFKGVQVRAEPGGQLLVACGFGVRVGT